MRIAITGVGLVCSLGHSVDEMWPRLVRGDRGITPVTLFDTQGFAASIAGQVHPAFENQFTQLSRTDNMALQAAREAIEASKLNVHIHRVGLIVGGTTAGMYETETQLARVFSNPKIALSTDELQMHILSSTVTQLQKHMGPFSRTRTLCSACSSGANAIAVGASWLRLGLVDVVIVGGVDGLCRLVFAGFNALGVMASEPARPFDRSRKGMTLGEGAGFLVLESAKHAQARNASWSVEFIGSGITSDAHHSTNPKEDGACASKAIQKTLQDANVSTREIDYINAHGTATVLNDVAEANAIVRTFSQEAQRIYVSSIKGQLGHTLGAAGAIEAIVCVLALRDQWVPPTLGLEEIDPLCVNIRHVQHKGISAPLRVALSNSFGFGGVNTVLAFAKSGYAPEKSTRLHSVFFSETVSYSTTGLLLNQDHVHGLNAEETSNPIESTLPPLDIQKARRFHSTTRLAAQTLQVLTPQYGDGILVGSTYGNIDDCSKFLDRFFQKGHRLVSPMEFPNLVPSSPSGHLSIYFGMHGPAFSILDQDASAEEALLTAWEFIAIGAEHSLITGTIENKSEILTRSVLSDSTEECAFLRLSTTPLTLSSTKDLVHHCDEQPQRQGGQGKKPERTQDVREDFLTRPTPYLGRAVSDERGLIQITDAIQTINPDTSLAQIKGPSGRGVVLLAHSSNDCTHSIELSSVWASCPLHYPSVLLKHSNHKGLLMVFAAAALIQRDYADSALVVYRARSWTYIFRLQRA